METKKVISQEVIKKDVMENFFDYEKKFNKLIDNLLSPSITDDEIMKIENISKNVIGINANDIILKRMYYEEKLMKYIFSVGKVDIDTLLYISDDNVYLEDVYGEGLLGDNYKRKLILLQDIFKRNHIGYFTYFNLKYHDKNMMFIDKEDKLMYSGNLYECYKYVIEERYNDIKGFDISIHSIIVETDNGYFYDVFL